MIWTRFLDYLGALLVRLGTPPLPLAGEPVPARTNGRHGHDADDADPEDRNVAWMFHGWSGF